jgi:predicted nucleic acid-binding protein
MRFVFDANILMAMLIGGRAFHKVILTTFDIITPDFALLEIDKYSPLILKKSRLSRPEHITYAHFVFSHLTIIPGYLIEQSSRLVANQLIGDIDPKDISYLALSVQTDYILVTHDKPIVEAARRRGFRRILLFDEFLAARSVDSKEQTLNVI